MMKQMSHWTSKILKQSNQTLIQQVLTKSNEFDENCALGDNIELELDSSEDSEFQTSQDSNDSDDDFEIYEDE